MPSVAFGGGAYIGAALQGGAAGGALALGASVVELAPGNGAFDLCVELLNRQAFCTDGSGVALSVLRVMQIQDHYVDLPAILQRIGTGASNCNHKGQASSTSLRSSPKLAFVSGELDELATFVRQNLRLLGSSDPAGDGTIDPASTLVVSECLDESQGWGGATRRTSPAAEDNKVPIAPAPPSLRVWRVVLAVCWPADEEGSKRHAGGEGALMPAFIIDYAAERLACQLGVR